MSSPKQPPQFEHFARKIEPGLTASRSALANPEMAQLRQLETQLAGSAQAGATVVFAGTDRDAKIAAATALASELHVNLFVIDMTAVVSKFIGETEKNLDKIFNSAEASRAILFFDEADTLFGKRSEVRDTHDRFANIEVNFLLQRIERSHAIAIFATTAVQTDGLHHVAAVLHFPPSS
jgi:SpoVK/Ycf46/Vps4 family AAA+-type ATPase